MANDVSVLVSMGFAQDKAEEAVKRMGGLQSAMDWLLEGGDRGIGGQEGDDHDNDDDHDDDEVLRSALGRKINVAQASNVTPGPTNQASPPSTDEAKSLRCSECGKIFRTPDMAQIHAVRAGHENFEESTQELAPLSEAEKKARLQELREKLAKKRAGVAKEDLEHARLNEEIRRKAGKETESLKHDVKLKQAEKDAKERQEDKRQEMLARNRVRAEIEADKKRRLDEAAAAKAARLGQTAPVASTPSSVSQAAASTSTSTTASSATEARLQIRFTSGEHKPMTMTVPATTTLSQLLARIGGVSGAGAGAGALSLSQTYPRKVLGDGDLAKSVRELGLCPSAVLMASVQ